MRELSSLELKDGVRVQLITKTNRTVLCSPTSAQYEKLDDSGKIKEIDYNGELQVKKGTVLKVGKQEYKIQTIVRSKSSNAYEFHTFRKISTTANFIFPFLGFTRFHFRWALEFTNAFIGDINNHDGTEVSLLYRWSGKKEFSEFEEELMQMPSFISSSDPDPYHTLYTFKIPDRYLEDTKLIMLSKYSKISQSAKDRIMEFHNSSKKLPIGQILYQCDSRRKVIESDIGQPLPKDAELYERFDIKQEIYLDDFKIPHKDGTAAGSSDFV